MEPAKFYATLETPKNISPELKRAVEFLVTLIRQNDLEHQMQIAMRDHRLQSFVGQLCVRLGADPDEVERLWRQSEREALEKFDEIAKGVRERREATALEGWFKTQFLE